jgi:hypothetical protein
MRCKGISAACFRSGSETAVLEVTRRPGLATIKLVAPLGTNLCEVDLALRPAGWQLDGVLAVTGAIPGVDRSASLVTS